MSSKIIRSMSLVGLLFAGLSTARAAAPPKGQAADLAAQIRQADYAGDRRALQRLYDELGRFVTVAEIAAPVRYWRGFAMWRRTINGFNEPTDPVELEQDLLRGVVEFDAALQIDAGYFEAQIGAAGCEATLIYVNRSRPEDARKYLARAIERVKKVEAVAPDNPRLLWVLGPGYWTRPESAGGGQAKAIELYERGLSIVRAQAAPSDPLQPSWGEAELLMSLAWSHLNARAPDLVAAERYARSALEIALKWHYVRDILLPQILNAKGLI